MTSYILQGVTSLLFGPLLGFPAAYTAPATTKDGMFGVPDGAYISKHLLPVATNIHQANILVAFSTFVASAVRLAQIAPLAELVFIASLAHYQFLTAVLCTVSYEAVHQKKPLRALVRIYMLVATAMYIHVSRSATKPYPVAHAKALQDVTAFCVRDRDWPAAEIAPEQPEEWSYLRERFRVDGLPWYLTWYVTFNRLTNLFPIVALVAATALGVVGLCVYPLSQRIAAAFNKPYHDLCKHLNFGPERFAGIVLAALATVIGTCLTAVSLAGLFHQRQQLRAASGDQYADNQWGFGQVTAVMAWIPVAQEALFACSNMFT